MFGQGPSHSQSLEVYEHSSHSNAQVHVYHLSTMIVPICRIHSMHLGKLYFILPLYSPLHSPIAITSLSGPLIILHFSSNALSTHLTEACLLRAT